MSDYNKVLPVGSAPAQATSLTRAKRRQARSLVVRSSAFKSAQKEFKNNALAVALRAMKLPVLNVARGAAATSPQQALAPVARRSAAPAALIALPSTREAAYDLVPWQAHEVALLEQEAGLVPRRNAPVTGERVESALIALAFSSSDPTIQRFCNRMLQQMHEISQVIAKNWAESLAENARLDKQAAERASQLAIVRAAGEVKRNLLTSVQKSITEKANAVTGEAARAVITKKQHKAHIPRVSGARNTSRVVASSSVTARATVASGPSLDVIDGEPVMSAQLITAVPASRPEPQEPRATKRPRQYARADLEA